MAVSINWTTKVITIPQADLTLISGVLYELDVDWFRLQLKNIEDSEGMTFPDTHRHNQEVTLSGVTYARTVEIINGYTVQFEDDQYTVRCVGANHNLADVKVANQVSLVVGNSAGLVSGGGVDNSAEILEILRLLRNKQTTNPTTGVMTVFADDGVTPLRTAMVYEDVAGTQTYRGQGADRRDALT